MPTASASEIETPNPQVASTSDIEEDRGFWPSAKKQISPTNIGIAAGATIAPIPAAAAGFGLSDRESFQTPEKLQEIHDSFKKAHDEVADAIKKGDYKGAARIGQDLFLGSGMREPVDAIEDQIGRGDYAGAAGTALGGLAQFAIGHGVGKLADFAGPWISKLRTPDPDLSILRAVKPHAADTDFSQNVPAIRADVKRGEALSDTPITDVPSTLKAVDAAMKEKMQALDAHKEVAKNQNAVLPTSIVRANALKALPPGLELSNPEEYNAAVHEINGLFPGKDYLNTDEVFDQAHLINGKQSRFFAAPEAAQNTKMVTNSGDMGTLKAIGDTYRQWISDHLGPMASDLNGSWGDLNQFKHYLLSKVNPALLEKPLTPLESGFDRLGLTPTGTINKDSVVSGAIKKLAGSPSKIDDFLKSAFENTDPSKAPVEPNPYSYLGKTKQLPAGATITPPPADTSYVRGADAAVQPPNPARALPPATTRVQGDVSPGSGLPAAVSHTLPTLEDGTKLTIMNAAKGIARDPKTGKFFRYYTSGEAPTPIKTLKLSDLQ